jgi:ATP adenylyltransferase
MKKLWAPWRMKYLEIVDEPKDDCIFCSKPKENSDRENLILFRGTYNFVIMNKYPYNNGHLMVVPYLHTHEPSELDSKTVLESWNLINMCRKILKSSYNPEGFNIGMNLGRVAGAGIDDHIHTHIVPRWNGDTNFMPILGETKVVSQGLLEGYDILKEQFDKS